MAAKPRTLAQLTSHPWVESVSDERSSGCGIWVYLKPGFVTHDCCHTIHETTVKECCRAFSYVWNDPNDYLLEDAPRPVLPGEQTPPPARSHGDAAPTLPDVASAGLAKLAEARAQRRQRREAAAMAMDGVVELLSDCAKVTSGDGWVSHWDRQGGRVVDAVAALGWIETRELEETFVLSPPRFLILCRITDAGRVALDDARAQQRREAAAMAMGGVSQLLEACIDWRHQVHCGDGWIIWGWHGQAGRAVDTVAALGWIETREGLGLRIQCRITDAGRAALASHAAV